MSKNGPVDRPQLYEEVAEEVQVHPEKVREAVRFQFRFVRTTIKEGDFDGVRLPYFGLFHAKDERIEHLERARKKAQETDDE